VSLPAYDDDDTGLPAYSDEAPWSPGDPPGWEAAVRFYHLALPAIEGARAAASAMIRALRQLGQPAEADARAGLYLALDDSMREAMSAALSDSGHLSRHMDAFFSAMREAARLLELPPGQDEDQEPGAAGLAASVAGWIEGEGVDLAAVSPAEVVGLLGGPLKQLLLSALAGHARAGNVELARPYPVSLRRIGTPSGYPATADAASVPAQGGDARAAWPRLPAPPPGGIWGAGGTAAAPVARLPRSRGVRRRRAQQAARARRRAAAAGRFWRRAR
jgi:hypothetical protein